MHKPSTNRKLIFNTKIIMLINLCIDFLIILFFVPVISKAIKYSMHLSNLSYITNANVLHFLLTPATIIIFLVLLIIVPFLLLSKFVSLIYYCNIEGKLRRPYLLRIIAYGIFKTIYFIRKKHLSILYYSVAFYLFTLLPVIIGITIYSNLGNSLNMVKELSLKLLTIVFYLILSLLFFPSAFAIHYGMLNNISLKEACIRSKMLFMENTRKILRSFYITNLQLTVLYFLFYYLLLILIAIAAFTFSNKSLAVSVFLSAYPKINFYAMMIYSMLAFVVNMNLLNSLFHNCQNKKLPKTMPNVFSRYHKRYLTLNQNKYLLNALFILMTIAAIINFYVVIRNDSLYLNEALSGIQISSHRGNSHIAPENTIPAIENAILANSDYAEIDIQETKDGSIILLHDKNLFRTAGVNRNIWEMTLEEVSQLDAGSWFGDEFIDTRIPTLEEVLQLSKGRIKLNIEIKKSSKSPDIADKLVALIEQYEFVDQCVVSSVDYSTLVKVKAANQDIKTGYILTTVYEIYHNKDNIDFYSIRSSFITKTLVDTAHQSGKEIHAWTVNSPRELERLKSINVDCIITDNPTLAREVLYLDDSNNSIIQLIKKMYVNRSLYSISNLNN